jgi:hypothetical protein
MRLTPEQEDQLSLFFEDFKSEWYQIRATKNEIPWTRGDVTLKYVKLVQALVDLSENAILDILAELVDEKSVTLRGYIRVSKAFPDGDIRNKEKLSWSHYRYAIEPASKNKPKSKKTPTEWINIAAEENLSVKALVARIAEDKDIAKECLQCKKALSINSTLRLQENNKLVGDFCSYKCLAHYALDAPEIKDENPKDYE